MDILVVAATVEELSPFLRSSEEHLDDTDILVTGVGMVATAYALGKQLTTRHYDLLLNVGIAGSFDPAIEPGEVVYVYQDTFAELGAEDGEQFLDSHALNLAQHTFQGSLKVDHPMLADLRRCKGITVNTVHGNDSSIRTVVDRLHPDTESMEGAAVYYAATATHTPAIQVRAISNRVERRDKASWQISLAIENLNQWLIDFVRQI